MCFAHLSMPACSLCVVVTLMWELDWLPHGFYPSRGAWEWTAWRVGAQSHVIHCLVQDRPSLCHVWDLPLYRRETQQNYFTQRGSRLFSFLFCPLSPFFSPPWSGLTILRFVKAIVGAHHRGSQKEVCHCSIGDWWVVQLKLHVFVFYETHRFCFILACKFLPHDLLIGTSL